MTLITKGSSLLGGGGRIYVPSPSGGVIPTAAASMVDGEFRSVTLPQVWTISAATGASIFEFVSRAFFDGPHNKIRFVGAQHGAPAITQYCDYVLATDTAAQEAWSNDPENGQPHHSYAGCDVNPTTGTTFYFVGQGSNTLLTRSNAGVYSSFTNNQGPNSGQGWANCAWHPGLGKLVIGQIWGIFTFDPSNNTFGTITTSSGGTLMSDGAGTAAYNLKDGCAYVGNTTSANAACYKVTAGGVATAISLTGAPPLGVQSAGNNNAVLLSAANPAHKLLAIQQDATTKEYDDVGNSWSSALTTDASWVSFIQGATDNQWIGVEDSTDGVLAFFRQVGDNMDTTAWLWKH